MVTKDQEPPKASSIDDRSNNYEVCTMEYYAAVRKNEAALCESIWTKFRDTFLREAARGTRVYEGRY